MTSAFNTSPAWGAVLGLVSRSWILQYVATGAENRTTNLQTTGATAPPPVLQPPFDLVCIFSSPGLTALVETLMGHRNL